MRPLSAGPANPRRLIFQSGSLDDMRALPDAVRNAFGHALWQVQNSETPDCASPFEGSIANDVMKLSERHDGDTYRCVYAAKFARAVYVLHVFQKKSKSGVATAKKDVDLVRARLERARANYAARFGAEGR